VLTKAGVKLLDFGLAKLTDHGSSRAPNDLKTVSADFLMRTFGQYR
jgi:hypothetical protein